MGAVLSGGTPLHAVPAFVLCDGHFEVSQPSGSLSEWCGWIRFEGHGECKLRLTEGSTDESVGVWKVVDDETVRIEISQGMPGRLEALLLREGSEINTIHLSVEGGDADPLLFVFVTEEKISETTEAFRKAGEFG